MIKRRAFDKKLSHVSSVTLHLFEPLNRSTGRSSAEMQQISQFFLVKCLHLFPKPDDYVVLWVINSLVVRVFFPVPHINVGYTVKDHFHFVGLENTEKILWYNFVESCFDGIKRSIDYLGTQMFHTEYYKKSYQD